MTSNSLLRAGWNEEYGRESNSTATATLEVVIPVYNEEDDLEQCVRRLHEHLDANIPFRAQITIADNASTDRTLAVAHSLAADIDGVRVHHLNDRGRGRALKAAWSASEPTSWPTWTWTSPPISMR